ncbi:hypothetical protein WI37_25545 [Burkholderia ubonensis]|nr:hypothetical protein WI37_25545 [Burkholderia ubonensis]
MVFEHQREYGTQGAAIRSIAAKMGMSRETLRKWVNQAERDRGERPATAEKLRRASPHWMRHTHASHALARGAELIMVRDNLRHASISTTSTYLHSDEVQRARQFDQAFGAHDRR